MKKNTDLKIDCCAQYDPIFDPPEDFLEECRRYWASRSPFNGIIEKHIGNKQFKSCGTACYTGGTFLCMKY